MAVFTQDPQRATRHLRTPAHDQLAPLIREWFDLPSAPLGTGRGYLPSASCARDSQLSRHAWLISTQRFSHLWSRRQSFWQ